MQKGSGGFSISSCLQMDASLEGALTKHKLLSWCVSSACNTQKVGRDESLLPSNLKPHKIYESNSLGIGASVVYAWETIKSHVLCGGHLSGHPRKEGHTNPCWVCSFRQGSIVVDHIAILALPVTEKLNKTFENVAGQLKTQIEMASEKQNCNGSSCESLCGEGR